MGFAVELIADESLEAKEAPAFSPQAPVEILSSGEFTKKRIDTLEETKKPASGSAYFAYDLENLPEWVLPVQAEPGRHRTVLLMDGEPVPAFDGGYYLDWENESFEQNLIFPLDLSFLPEEGAYNLYSVTIDLETDLETIKRSIWAAGDPVTVEATEGAGS